MNPPCARCGGPLLLHPGIAVCEGFVEPDIARRRYCFAHSDLAPPDYDGCAAVPSGDGCRIEAVLITADARRTEEEGIEPCWACEGRGSSVHAYNANCTQPDPPAEEAKDDENLRFHSDARRTEEER